MKTTRLITFLALFTSVYGGAHYYVFGRLFTWFGAPLGITYIAIVTAVILLFPVATALEQRYLNWVTRIIYTVSSIWTGVLGILVFCVLIAEIIAVVWGGVFAALFATITTTVLGVYALINGRRFIVQEHTITGEVKKPFRFALITDAHAGAVHGKRYLQLIVDRIKQEQSLDAVCISGDLVDGPGKLPDDLLKPLDEINVPVLYSFGNHEEYVGEQEVARVLKGRKITSLRSQYHDFKEVRVIGVDDSEDKKQVLKETSGLTKIDSYNILLYHRPDGLVDAAKNGVNLMLSGHTHNGQIFPFNLLVRLRFPRKKGWYTHGNTKLYVSTGTGTWGPPMRLGSRSELTFITVLPA